MNILAIGAHPDDLDISCGGTLLRFRRTGENVVMCVVTDGRAHPLGNPEEVSARRRQEAQASADLIGAELVWLGFPDGRLTDDDVAPGRAQRVLRVNHQHGHINVLGRDLDVEWQEHFPTHDGEGVLIVRVSGATRVIVDGVCRLHGGIAL